MQVDPFVIPIPEQFRKDPNVNAFMQYLVRFLHDLWTRTGAGDDAIYNLEVINTYETTALNGKISGLIDQLANEKTALALSSLSGQCAALQQEITYIKTQIALIGNANKVLVDKISELQTTAISKSAAMGYIASVNDRLSNLENG